MTVPALEFTSRLATQAEEWRSLSLCWRQPGLSLSFPKSDAIPDEELISDTHTVNFPTDTPYIISQVLHYIPPSTLQPHSLSRHFFHHHHRHPQEAHSTLDIILVLPTLDRQ